MVRLPGPPLSIQCTPLQCTPQPFPVSQGFYPVFRHSYSASACRGCEVAPIPQRLAGVCTFPGPGGSGYVSPPQCIQAGSQGRLGEELSCPCSAGARLHGHEGRTSHIRHPPSPSSLQEGQETDIWLVPPATGQADGRIDRHSYGPASTAPPSHVAEWFRLGPQATKPGGSRFRWGVSAP